MYEKFISPDAQNVTNRLEAKALKIFASCKHTTIKRMTKQKEPAARKKHFLPVLALMALVVPIHEQCNACVHILHG